MQRQRRAGTPSSSRNEATSDVSAPMNDVRKRATKRDEAIRRKIEAELSRKRGTPKKTRLPTRAGTVSALRPSAALTVRESITVAEASQLMAAKRADCVLVVDANDHLSGIFTAKDLAFRVVGDGLDSRTTTVSQIMTKNPMLTRSDTSATEALNTMVTRGFRHLPVCNEDGDVVGLLDITKVFHEALEKLERAYESSSKLYSALEGVQSEWAGSGSQPQAILQYVEQLREKMSSPDLTTVMDGEPPAMVTLRTSVKEAAMLMKERHTTAVCVMDDKDALAGIFTSKDIVLRVIATGLDPRTCSVVRVMTPHPDISSPTTSIQVALRKMHDGHYLNLPVVDDNGGVIGCVNILQLTYATLEQINTIQGTGDGQGPMWNRFWDSFGQGDNESVHSDSQVRSSIDGGAGLRSRSIPSMVEETPELHPHESVSAYEGDTLSQASEPNRVSTLYDDGVFAFKFKAPSGKVHRFQCEFNSFKNLRLMVMEKLDGEEVTENGSERFSISYVDDEGDYVTMTTDQDVLDAVQQAKRQKVNRVLLFVQDPQAVATEKPSTPTTVPVSEESQENESINSDKQRERKADIYGIPHELLLPGAIVVLAIAIIGVSFVSRSSSTELARTARRYR